MNTTTQLNIHQKLRVCTVCSYKKSYGTEIHIIEILTGNPIKYKLDNIIYLLYEYAWDNSSKWKGKIGKNDRLNIK